AELVKKIGRATAQEVIATGINWVFAPTVAVAKDDRWGRTYESYSDQLEIVERYSTEIVEGLQGADNGLIGVDGVVASVKHFIGDGATYKGEDQGDARMSLDELLDLHGGGFLTGINSGAQTVMASFNSWNGKKVHGSRELLTGVLKEDWGFDGFVVSDWNGHGQIAGCNNTSCAQAINAGVDMFMLPTDWKEFIENTLGQVRAGEINESRIDDAVRRILRVKIRAGLFDGMSPEVRASALPKNIVGSNAHRELAREAVRKSLVLLKDNEKLLPLDPAQNILVAGSGANDIGKQSGGWTLSWQGTGNTNADFPGATSIWDGIRQAVESAGGKAELSDSGTFEQRPDVAIVVFGETPYAEGQGDIDNLDFNSVVADELLLLRSLKAQEIPTVAVFLSGRPMWVNPEFNASDAFVAAWLPGSEGAGIADVIIADKEGNPRYDFQGRLSYDWPLVDVNQTDTDLPVEQFLFPYGYGLNYQSDKYIEKLDENALGTRQMSSQVIMSGSARPPFTMFLGDESNWDVRIDSPSQKTHFGELEISPHDRLVQEDSRKLIWSGSGNRISQFYLRGDGPMDFSRLGNEAAISLVMSLDERPVEKVTQRMDCNWPCSGEVDLTGLFQQMPLNEWVQISVPLKCFADSGADLSRITVPFVLVSTSSLGITLSEVRITAEPSVETIFECGL
ncbi:MAG: exo 1,3/1,4-beta-D-glucan glucohydrolase, partial [Pseudomonadales bacterium]